MPLMSKYITGLLILCVVSIVVFSGCVDLADKQINESSSLHSTEGMGDLCSTKEECESYCVNHQTECMNYCETNQDSASCQMGPDGSPADEYTETIAKLSMPFKIEDFNPTDWGVWPFCVHGGDHPEGHGGIDFELHPDTKILASADGEVVFHESIEEDPHGWGEGIFIDYGGSAMYSFACMQNLQVKVGDKVTKGQFIGNPCKTDEGESFVHYEIADFTVEKRVCPIDYIDDEFRTALDEMFKDAKYIEQSVEPDLCNCEYVHLPQPN